MAKATLYQCPNCGGIASFDVESGRVTCAHCGHVFDAPDALGSIPVGGNVQGAAAPSHVRTVEEFLSRAPWEPVDEEAVNAVTYSCPACAARIVADQSIVATACPFCGNNLLLQGLASAQSVPQEALPFSLTKDQAQDRLQEHFRGKWYLPRSFSAEVVHVQGVYVPYYLYDLRAWGKATYVVREGRDDPYRYRLAGRTGHAAFVRIPVDGSSRMPDAHMDAIAPFDLDDARPFSAGFAAGFVMELPDESAADCEARAEARVRHTFETHLAYNVTQGRMDRHIEKTLEQETNARAKAVRTCVLPVWLMHCTWEGEHMLFAVNGTTGKCVGDLPVDKRRRVMTIAGIVAATIAAVVLVFLVANTGDADSDTLEIRLRFACGILVAGILAVIYVDQRHMSAMHTAKEEISARDQYDDEGLVLTESWQDDESYSSVSRCLQQRH